MKKFQIVTDNSVTLFNWREPLPVNCVYGRIGENVYVFIPYTGHLTVYDVRGREVVGNFPAIKELLAQFRQKWESLEKPVYCQHIQKDVDCIHEMKKRGSRPAVGGPREKKAQADFIFRCKPQGGSLNDDIAGEYKEIDGERVFVPRKGYDRGVCDPYQGYFEVGQRTAGPAAFVAKKDGMYVHDTLKCRDKEETVKVSGEIRSRKEDALVYGVEYAAVNNMTLSENDAIRAYISGGLSAYARKKVLDQI